VGGAEHTTGHLLYARFWTKFLYDLGYIPFDEPFQKLINQGMILGRSSFVYRKKGTNTFVSKGLIHEHEVDTLHVDISLVDNDVLDIEKFKLWRAEYAKADFMLENGKYYCGAEIEKMSKSKHNVQTPDELVEKFGADTLRCYEMFLGPVQESKPWDTKGINGVHNFLRKFWRLFHQTGSFVVSEENPSAESLKTLHRTIKRVGEDIERFSLNTVVSTLMIAVNELQEQACKSRAVLEPLTILLSSYAPHLAEEIWQKLGHSQSIYTATFPKFEEKYLVETSFNYPVSFNGKMRFQLTLPLDYSEEQIKTAVLAEEQTTKYLQGQKPKKWIVVKGKIINIVI
jgi:leucyl-tRNA synthetase